MTTKRVLTWDVIASRGYETVWAEVGRDGLRARGRAVGTVPEPYWVTYELDSADGFVTRRLAVTVETADRVRTLDLRHDGHGRWTADGRPLPEADGALDCDLGLCPLTNTLPVLRHGLHRPGAVEREFLMAWVSVPDLAVRPSRQTYTPLGPAGTVTGTGTGSRVRYASGTFRSDIVLDADGFVADYPELARRLG
ncbi:putative glycolipid-binding domain-containing protein [Streptomyces sp. NPDC001595]|uniref:putative glycolipid-binding domain-containing protein n=1 Tax=Streptomyces sp. NPDC001532 TaxID=3154520 RepID=UPI003320DD7E